MVEALTRSSATIAIATFAIACGESSDEGRAGANGGAAGVAGSQSTGGSAGTSGAGGSAGTAGTAGSAGAGGTSGAAGAGNDGGTLDPASYDCRAMGPVTRHSPVATSCALDTACRERLLSAHRGAGGPGVLAPENTLSAIRASILVGADFIEGDVNVTKDGELVLMHDDTVDRTTQGTGALADLTLAEVQALDLDVPSNVSGDFSCDRVPRFADVLALTKGRVVFIIDGSKTDRTDLIAQAVADADAFDWVVYDHTVSNWSKIEAAVALEPRFAIQVRADDATQLDEVTTRFASHPPIQIHIEDADPNVMAPLVHAKGFRVFALGFTRDIIVGASGDLNGYDALFDAGIDGVQSNRPELLARYLGR